MPRLLLPSTSAALILLASLPGCHRADASAPSAAPTEVGKTQLLVAPEPVRHAPTVIATGTLKPRWQAQLAFPVAGTLERIAVKRGQAVAEGAPLLALDAAAARALLAQAESGVAAAKAQLVLAEDGLARLEAIRKEQGGVTDAQLVQARGQRDLAQAQVLASEAQREQARVNLDHHTLRAPFAGVVTRIPDGRGVAVGAGAPLVALESVRQLVLETSLTQAEAAEIRAGAKVKVSVAATGVHTSDATVTVVVPSVDAGTSRVPVEIEVPNANGRFLPNAFARARLPSGAPRNALRVPAAAVVQKEGAYAVWIAGQDGRARALPVRVLAQESDLAVVDAGSSGFPAGSRVVALPPVGIAEGQLLAQVSAR
jgi:RND family efflux transporter MFP subunit